jgi:hypothetical protein
LVDLRMRSSFVTQSTCVLEDVEEDLPHLLGDLGRVARDLEDVEDHLEARLGIGVDTCRHLVRLLRLDVRQLRHRTPSLLRTSVYRDSTAAGSAVM